MLPQVDDCVLMVDTSRHNGLYRPAISVAQGVKIHAGRLTVGNYYVDERGIENFDKGQDAGLVETFYLVVAPEYSALDHLLWYRQKKAGRKPMRGTIVDVELFRNQAPGRIASVVYDICVGLEEDEGERPFIYTRQSFWDRYVAGWVGWKKYPLIAARYNTSLTSPWSDGYFKFRDWDDWAGWQVSADGNGLGPTYGGESPDIDLSLAKASVFGITPAPTLEQRVASLETQARAHGWEI